MIPFSISGIIQFLLITSETNSHIKLNNKLPFLHLHFPGDLFQQKNLFY